jgi:hypothetical protein
MSSHVTVAGTIILFPINDMVDIKYWFPSASHSVYMFSAMTFTEYSATCLTGNSTSYA